LNEFNGINQEYRAFEIPSFNESIQRLDFYSDYIYIVKPEFLVSNSVSETDTTIYQFETRFQNIFNHLNGASYIPQAPFGNDTKITYAFVRTDGFLTEFPDIANQGSASRYNAIMTPVVSFGGKNNLNFNFKFDNNQIAGDAITPSTTNNVVTNYYNKPIRYTDSQGFFDKLWFGMASNTTLFMFNETNKFPDIAGEDELYFNDLYAYPLVAANDFSLQQDFLIKNQDFTNPDWFIIYKDAATNYGFSYQLNIIPLDFNDYIIGQNFYTENPLVMNQDVRIEKKLYIYTNGTIYNMFDDLKIKSGFNTSIDIDGNNLVVDTETFSYNFEGNTLSALSNATSWAIGDNEGNLFLACNKPYTGFKLLARHNRLNTFNIGQILQEIYVGPKIINFVSEVVSTFVLESRSNSGFINFDSDYKIAQRDEVRSISGFVNFDSIYEVVQREESRSISGFVNFDSIYEVVQREESRSISGFVNFDSIYEVVQREESRSISGFINFDSISDYFTLLKNQVASNSGFVNFESSSTYTSIINYETKEASSNSGFVNFDSNAVYKKSQNYQLRGYATATPVNITVDFDDQAAFTFTMQTFIQIIGTKLDGTNVTVTAPESYVLNGFTYVFIDWRIDETGQTVSNRIFTTEINQTKTLRLRYVAFAEF
jgi:hypothetical protein